VAGVYWRIMQRSLFHLFCIVVGFKLLLASALAAEPAGPQLDLFSTGSQCIACHSNMVVATGEDISIGYAWRASMMANSGRDPYWLASVRREVIDHPQAQEAIEDKCATCHMPAARYLSRLAGAPGKVFEHNRAEPPDPALARMARDGVNCSVCHQITAQDLGETISFTGGFHIDTAQASGRREMYGPHEIDRGLTRVMNSASGFVPKEADHLASSEMCATCHTLYTHALDDQGNAAGQLPEQVPFLEWQHSDFRETRSCQDCHMPVLPDLAPISSVLGEPRPQLSQHVFRGGNVFMLRMLNTYRDELGVEALPEELESAARQTEQYLQTHAAELHIESVTRKGGRLDIALRVANLAGHKLPTAYPSRRAWLHLAVTDRGGRTVFESGAVNADGSITGNDGDSDAMLFEPHHQVIESGEQVQVYESVMGDFAGRVTTGLMYGVRYLKDNRILPRGFDKETASEDVAVHGEARNDDDFAAAGDRVIYRLDLPAVDGPFRIQAELLYQSIAYRWAMNLKDYAAADEPGRFVRWYEESAAHSALTLASDRWEGEAGP